MLKVFLLTLAISFNSYSKEFTRYLDDKNPRVKIEIKEHDGLWVNDQCINNFGKCLSFFINKNKAKKKAVKDPNLAGHPASSHCSAVGGTNEIFIDEQNNQHDYCIFKEGYIIDSWNLMKRFK